MARLSARSVKSRQKQTLRYIASTDIERTARDYGVSTRQLRNFLTKDPKSVDQRTYDKILATDAKQLAREKEVRLVPRLTTDKYNLALKETFPADRTVRSLRYTSVVRERIRKVDDEGKVHYKPVSVERQKTERAQILGNMSGMNTKRIVNMYQEGLITRGEAKQMMRKLYKNSGVSASRADAALRKALD